MDENKAHIVFAVALFCVKLDFRQFPAATGAEVRLWTRSRILKKESFSKIIITSLPRLGPDLRECVTSMIFQELLIFFFLGGLAGGSPMENLTPIFFCFQKIENRIFNLKVC